MIELKAEDDKLLHLSIFKPEDHYLKPEDYTCHKCGAKDNCEYAWDDYNTNGDCLAEK